MARATTTKAPAAGRRPPPAAGDAPSWRDGPIRDPSINKDKLPTSWADGRYTPPAGMVCSSCGGSRFSRAGEGWCCDRCHPAPSQAGLRTIDTMAVAA
jgi:hypothetical protein